MKTEKEYMEEEQRSNWTWKRLTLPSIAIVLFLAAATTQASSSTGIDVNGTDIMDSGTVIWDSSTGNSNVFLDEDGDTLSGNIDMNKENNITNLVKLKGSFVNSNGIEFNQTILMENNDNGGDLEGLELRSTNNASSVGDGLIKIAGGSDDIFLDADTASNGSCTINSNADFSCSGTKSWVHKLNSTYEAVYTSQESPQVRATYEGQTRVEGGKVKVELPSHFSKTVSDKEPSLRVVATPHSLATVAVTERTDDYLVIKASKDVKVDYRVTGIREGYTDKQVVRPIKEE